MTELMKQYEAEIGDNSQIVWHGGSFASDDYIAWLEAQVLDGETIEKFQEILRRQCDEISSLKAQLTWRPVSEPTVKADWYLTKLKVDDDTLAYDVSWSDGKIFGDKLVVAWIPIPLTREGER